MSDSEWFQSRLPLLIPKQQEKEWPSSGLLYTVNKFLLMALISIDSGIKATTRLSRLKVLYWAERGCVPLVRFARFARFARGSYPNHSRPCLAQRRRQCTWQISIGVKLRPSPRSGCRTVDFCSIRRAESQTNVPLC